MPGSIKCEPWGGLDRQAFHENTILLECKYRSQGRVIKPSEIPTQLQQHNSHNFGLESDCIRDFLNDFALVASGSGGKNNVVAVCMEEEDNVIILRVAGNSGLSIESSQELNELLKTATKKRPTNTDTTAQEKRRAVLAVILTRCEQRVRKHTIAFLNELKNARCDGHHVPMFSHLKKAESPEDTIALGLYSRATHMEYMGLHQDRFDRLKKLCVDFSDMRRAAAFLDISVSLTETAYQLRRSASFKYFLETNIGATKKTAANQQFARALGDRLGKISRFFRAAITIAAVGEILGRDDKTILIKPLATRRYSIAELEGRSAADLKRRGGRRFSTCGTTRLQPLINRWPSYRLHAEIQLVVFYEEHPSATRVSSYIGCDKLCCYLCYKFLSAHGQFIPSGCHQSLYSLWTFPLSLQVENETRARIVTSALHSVYQDVEEILARAGNHFTPGYRVSCNNESFANLSRISLRFWQAGNNASVAELMGSNDRAIVGQNIVNLIKEVEGNIEQTSVPSAGEPSGSPSSLQEISCDVDERRETWDDPLTYSSAVPAEVYPRNAETPLVTQKTHLVTVADPFERNDRDHPIMRRRRRRRRIKEARHHRHHHYQQHRHHRHHHCRHHSSSASNKPRSTPVETGRAWKYFCKLISRVCRAFIHR